jgi:single-stranded-DNA-specific exonuclease
MTSYKIRDEIPQAVRMEFASHPPFLQELLYHRGIHTQEEAESFLNPNYYAHLHDPFLLPDMHLAVERINGALEKNEHIVIYSDYDMDGGPGGVILYDFFKKIGYTNFVNYIPHRHEEGYGLNTPAIEQFAKDGTKLVITVDCGIADVRPIARAVELGVDVIVTDHHLPNGELPSAYAIVNPKRKDSVYPFEGLCGAGVAFKLVQALLQHGDFGIKAGWEKWLLDMAGLATIADMVPLQDENRALAHFGLAVLRKSPRPGLQQLCRKIRVNQRLLTEDDVGFMIGPRINAASRMGEAMDAFHLLSTDDPVRAGVLAEHLNRVNDERKGVVASIAKEIKKRIRAFSDMRNVLVMGDPRWRPALLGLAANSLVEEYKRPVFLWGREGNNLIKGSCRSDGSVDLVALMSHAKDLFLDFGGHKFSGGFSVDHENVHHLEERLAQSYELVRSTETMEDVVYIDKELALDDVTWQTYAYVERLAPFGEGNPKPIFLFKEVSIKGMRQFGKDGGHLELTFEKSDGKSISAISFFTKPDRFEATLEVGKKIHLAATLEKSLFRSYPELRLRIVDIL